MKNLFEGQNVYKELGWIEKGQVVIGKGKTTIFYAVLQIMNTDEWSLNFALN